MRSIASRFGVALFVCVAFAPVASAQTVTVSAAADTYLRQGGANQNQGQETVLRVQQSGNNRTLVRMDQAAIAAAVGSGSLASATLELYATSSGSWGPAGRTIDLHRLTADWTENGATWNCADDTNPANSQPSCAAQWAGGTFEAEASDSVLHTNATSGYVQLNVTEDVRSFLAGAPNHGWLVKLADETASGNVDYTSRQGTSAQRPRLVLVVESAAFDQVPPTLAITSPSQAVLVNEPAPQIGLSYADGGSGVDLSSLVVQVDGVVAVCTPGAGSATCVPAVLGEGNHTITASLRDQAGNQATASRSFVLLVGPGRRSATFTAAGDTYLRQGEPNQSFGGESILRVRQSGRNRSLVRFNAAEIAQVVGTGTLVVARLELTVTKNGRNWSPAGRTVDAHRLTAAWTEAGATWNCATDTNLANSQPDCSPQWSGGTFQAAATASVLHTNDLSGTVSFDVTADVAALLAGTPSQGWLLKKTEEGQSGLVEYASREAGSVTAPWLVVVFDVPPGSGDTTAPSLAITVPAGTVYNDETPEIRVEYSDMESGVDPASLIVRVDGVAISGCTAGAASATCEPEALIDGSHQISAEVADRAGNRVTASRPVAKLTDVDPPMVVILRPMGPVYNDLAPAVEVNLVEAESVIDPSSLSLNLDGADISATCTVGSQRADCSLPSLAAGPHVLRVTARDAAGNQASDESTFTLIGDTTPPSLEFAEPAASGVFFGEPARAVVRFSDSESGVESRTLEVVLDGAQLESCAAGSTSASCPIPPLTQSSHTLAAKLRDRAGNLVESSVVFSVLPERQAPDLRFVAPAEPSVHGGRIPSIELSFSDDGSGIDPATLTVTVDGIDITSACQLGAGTASCASPPLEAGVHLLAAAISDTLGNRANVTLEVELSLRLDIAVTSPAQGTLVREGTIVLRGTVSSLATSVKVGDIEAAVSGGEWIVDAVPLREGSNALTVVARSTAGGIGSATVMVIRDTEAPRVAILSPRDGFVTSASQIVVSGDLVDSGSSTAVQRPLTVRVSGQVPSLERKSFVLADLLLVPGENRIEVTAEDAAGNVGTSAVTVRYVPDAAARIEKISGDFQEAPARETLPEPLLVQVVDSLGRPLAGRTVDFAVTRGDGAVISFPDAARRLSVVTDAEGLALVQLALGTRAGAGNQEVTASSVGIPGSIVFCASARTKAVQQLHPIVGTDFQGARSGAAGQPLPKPLLAQAFDEFGNPVPGVEVTFRATAGGGSFAGSNETLAVTDEEGKAGVIFTLGPDEGINNNVVEATFEGNEENPARFTISGMVPGPAELTSISGVLLDPQDGPVPGARMHVGNNEVRTDAEGKFRLSGVPVGTVHLGIDGATVTRPGVWPPLGYEMVTVSGRDNTLGKPLRLPQLDDAGKKWVGGNEDVVVPIRGVAGATLTVFANSATFPDGSREGWVSFTQVPSYKVPMVAPMNTNFQIAWSIQPAGVHFDPPARVSIPNFGADAGGGNPPGMTVEIFSFDHDLEEFVSAGTASITEDGQRMVSNPGMGVSKTGWGGCPRPPSPPAGACSRGTPPEPCKLCSGNGGPPVSQCTACETCTGNGCKAREVASVTAEAEGLEPELPAGATAAARKRIIPKAGDDEPVMVGVGQKIRFNSDKVGGDCSPDRIEAEWDFGDGSEKESDRTVEHEFKEEGDYTVTVSLDCKCPETASLRPKQAVTDTVNVTVADLIEGRYKLVGDEQELTPLDKDEDNDQKKDLSFRVLGGIRIKLSVKPVAILTRAMSYEWSATGGTFYNGPGANAQALTGAGLRGAALKELYWQPAATPGQNLDVTVNITLPENRRLVSMKKIKTRVLTVNSDNGDDVKMLTTLLHYMGVSVGPYSNNNYGVMGTPVTIQDNFSGDVASAVRAVQRRDQIGVDGGVGMQMLPKLERHWNDLYKAYTQFTDAVVNNQSTGFPGWIATASMELQTRYSAAAHMQIAGGVTYDTFMTSWVNKETAMFGHWGFGGNDYRTTLGTYDDHGSIGFSQVLNRFKYGSNDILPDYNLYEPDDAVKAFAHWSVTAGLGGGFVSAFSTFSFRETKTFNAGVYPRIGQLGQASQPSMYTDTTKDLLSKGVMAYNAGNGTVSGFNMPWPLLIIAQGPSGGDRQARRGVRYTLEIQGPPAANGVGAGMPLSSWNWVDALAITTGTDKVCDTTAAPGDIAIPVNPNGSVGQVCICPGQGGLQTRPAAGSNDQIMEFEFTYREQDWLNFDSWESIRDQAIRNQLPPGCP